MMLAQSQAIVWQWIATGAVGACCVLLGVLLRGSRERLKTAESAVKELGVRMGKLDREQAVLASTITNGLGSSIDRLQGDVVKLHEKIESAASNLGGKIDNIMGRLLDWAQSCAKKVGE